MRTFCTRGYREAGPAKTHMVNPRLSENRRRVSKVEAIETISDVRKFVDAMVFYF